MTDPLSPSMPDPSLETVITVGPKTMKSMLEHFPFGKGSKSDPQLVGTSTTKRLSCGVSSLAQTAKVLVVSFMCPRQLS